MTVTIDAAGEEALSADVVPDSFGQHRRLHKVEEDSAIERKQCLTPCRRCDEVSPSWKRSQGICETSGLLQCATRPSRAGGYPHCVCSCRAFDWTEPGCILAADLSKSMTDLTCEDDFVEFACGEACSEDFVR